MNELTLKKHEEEAVVLLLCLTHENCMQEDELGREESTTATVKIPEQREREREVFIF